MKKIGYIIYCIIIIVISITINVFIGNSDRKLDYIMNDVIEHMACQAEEEECNDSCVPKGTHCPSVSDGDNNNDDDGDNSDDVVAPTTDPVNDEHDDDNDDDEKHIDYPYFEAGCNNMNTKHYMDKSLQSLIDDGCLIGRKANDIFPANFDKSLESGNVKTYCKDNVFTDTWSSPCRVIDNS